MQPSFAGWSMVERDGFGQDTLKPRMATPHPMKKKPSLLLSQVSRGSAMAGTNI